MFSCCLSCFLLSFLLSFSLAFLLSCVFVACFFTCFLACLLSCFLFCFLVFFLQGVRRMSLGVVLQHWRYHFQKILDMVSRIIHFLYNYTASSQIVCDPKFSEQHSKEETNNVLSGSHYPGLQATASAADLSRTRCVDGWTA